MTVPLPNLARAAIELADLRPALYARLEDGRAQPEPHRTAHVRT